MTRTVYVLALMFAVLAAKNLSGRAWSKTASDPVAKFEADLPAQLDQFTPERVRIILQRGKELHQWAADLADFRRLSRPDDIVRRADQLFRLKSRVDALTSRILAQRASFLEISDEETRRARLRCFLKISGSLIDLSGRLRYLLVDALGEGTALAIEQNQGGAIERLLKLAAQHRSAAGAAVFVDGLFMSDPQPPERRLTRLLRPATPRIDKRLVLDVVTRSGDIRLIGPLADFVTDSGTSPALVLRAAVAIRHLGLPQDPRPGADPDLRPPITARELKAIVEKIAPASLSGIDRKTRSELLQWLDSRIERGVTSKSFRLGTCDVEPGDWLLMRNPSPYNRFTDLSPGLFTHVGVVTDETASDGRRRMVLVDLPERGQHVQATPIEAYVDRTLHYVVLRHKDPEVCRTMADVARAVVGNPARFDLNFRTQRIESLKGQPLAGREIHTYCAGLLLLCAQETGLRREAFFPVVEYPAEGNTVANLKQLGLSFGENFVSPTGALFSPEMKIVGRCKAMYDPHREIEEAIYDHFAARLKASALTPSPDWFQSLRLKLAEASRSSPLLAKALAEAAGVSENQDLVSAAKAAAVVETLDQIARENRLAFRYAREAVTAGPAESLSGAGFEPNEIAAIAAYRDRHAKLFASWAAGRLSPRELRVALVNYYTAKGKRQLDKRFFSEPEN